MTITNKDYTSSLGNKESEDFKRFSKEIESDVDEALEGVKGFVYSKVERFSEGNKINCQMTVFVNKTSSATEEEIQRALGDEIGAFKITNVIVVDTMKPTTLPPTEPPTAEEEIVFEVTVTIPDEEFTEELSDSSSPKFKALAADLSATLTNVLKEKVANFLRVEIIGFRKGSIICIFNVITEEVSTASDEQIKEVLTTASEGGQTGNYTFTEITVEKKVTAKKQTGDKKTVLPDWVIGVISVFAVMVLLIILMIYLLCRKRRIQHHSLEFLDVYDNYGKRSLVKGDAGML
ncbi:hypothetical protein ACROYT_G036479 [Oculina patagonica]